MENSDKEKPAIFRDISVTFYRALVGAALILLVYGVYYALGQKFVTKAEYQQALVTQYAEISKELRSHTINPDIHMGYQAKVDKFVTREEWRDGIKVREDTDAIIRKEVQDGFRSIDEKLDRRFSQMMSVLNTKN